MSLGLLHKAIRASLGSASPELISDIFSVDLWTGSGAAASVSNGIDLSSGEGAVWIKGRSTNKHHYMFDTARASTKAIKPSLPDSETTDATTLTSFNSNGYSIGSHIDINESTKTYVGFTFKKSAKFFDIISYTGDGISGKVLPHSLGAAPSMVIVKRLDASTAKWAVQHISSGGTKVCYLNETTAEAAISNIWNNSSATPSTVILGNNTIVNESGVRYIMYLLAHDTTAEGLIIGGNYTGTGTGGTPTVALGWKPQFLLIKSISSASRAWYLFDTTRGITATADNSLLLDNSTENTVVDFLDISATGFSIKTSGTSVNALGETYNYIAIREE